MDGVCSRDIMCFPVRYELICYILFRRTSVVALHLHFVGHHSLGEVNLTSTLCREMVTDFLSILLAGVISHPSFTR